MKTWTGKYKGKLKENPKLHRSQMIRERERERDRQDQLNCKLSPIKTSTTPRNSNLFNEIKLIGVLIEQSKTLLTSKWLNEKGHAALSKIKEGERREDLFLILCNNHAMLDPEEKMKGKE